MRRRVNLLVGISFFIPALFIFSAHYLSAGQLNPESSFNALAQLVISGVLGFFHQNHYKLIAKYLSASDFLRATFRAKLVFIPAGILFFAYGNFNAGGHWQTFLYLSLLAYMFLIERIARSATPESAE